MLTTILATVVVLGVLIFVHELGHFITAKWVDIEVPRFSIGFGPKIIGFRRGETEYVISALPLGGYVKMAGMEEMEAIEGGSDRPAELPGDAAAVAGERPKRPRDFESKSLPARALVISAGVIMNLLFAFVVFTLSAAVWGVAADPGTRIGGVSEEYLTAEAVALASIEPGSRITAVNDQPVTSWREINLALTRAGGTGARFTFEDGRTLDFGLPTDDETRAGVFRAIEPALPVPPVMAEVSRGGPAAEAGLRSNDRILTAGGREVSTWQGFVSVIERSPGEPVALTYERDGERFETTITPERRELDSGLVVGRIDVVVPSAEPFVPRNRLGLLPSIARGGQQTWDFTVLTVDFLAGMFSGRHSPTNVGGPIMIGQMSGRFARLGLEAFLGFMAILSVNLAVLNLLPIPVLDGGHLVFLGVEGIRGRPLSIEARMRFTQVGFVLIIMLMAWAIGNDLLRTIGF
ncbi:MAG TPA: RIP metalloprotease RseP [Longimicrobiales bacterium]|nr:RIP metalloprotease RseP [Longimicrobiales bacterium]